VKILGISGLDYSVDFRKRNFPNLPRGYERICQGFDSAAALCDRNGVIAAVAEERFNREKGTNRFPTQAIRYCLRKGGLRPSAIDVVAHAFSYEPYRPLYSSCDYTRRQFDEVYSVQAQIECLERELPGCDWSRKFVAVPHHEAHAASAFYLSGFTDALILVADGAGEQHSTTVAFGDPSGIGILGRVALPHSLGLFYGIFTHYLGFAFAMDEYKVMGLAPYGRPDRFFDVLMDLVTLRGDGL
jgi:carbamoyltransferase